MKTKYPFKQRFSNNQRQMINYNSNLNIITNIKENKGENSLHIKKKSSSTSNLDQTVDYFARQITQQIDKSIIENTEDFLNFSKLNISLTKIRASNSFSDIFNDRYDNKYTPINSSFNDIQSNNIKNDKFNQTPSTICNYYQKSEQNIEEDNKPIKTTRNEDKNKKNLKINYSKIEKKSIKSKEKAKQALKAKANLIQKIKVKRQKNFTKQRSCSYVTSFNVNLPNVLLNNYINSNVLHTVYKVKNSERKIKRTIKNKTSSMDTIKTSIIYHPSMIKNNTHTNITNSTSKKKKIIKKTSQQKPLMLYFDQLKYDAYFVSPNSKKENKSLNKNKATSAFVNKTYVIKPQRSSVNKSISQSSYSNRQKPINHMKISKILTEQNSINKIQATPKVSKNSYVSSISSLALNCHRPSKENCHTNSAKVFKMNLNNGINNHMNIIKFDKAKTQSALKSKQAKSLLFNGNNSNIKKEVKQKLFDRMNKALKNNWNYLFRNKGEEDKNKEKYLENFAPFIHTPNKENNDSKN